jgi:chaperonin cofactor prefoldin
MLRTWKSFGLVALLVLLLPGQALVRENPEKPPVPQDTAKQLEQISKQLEEIKNQLKDLGEIREKIKTLEGAYGTTLKIPALESDLQKLAKTIADLSGQVGDLQGSVKQLSDRVDSLQSKLNQTAYKPPTGPTGASTLKIQNRSGVTATVTIDGQSYVLGPYETRLLENRPLGSFTYEVYADGFGRILSPTTRTLSAGETYTIRIDPGS